MRGGRELIVVVELCVCGGGSGGMKVDIGGASEVKVVVGVVVIVITSERFSEGIGSEEVGWGEMGSPAELVGTIEPVEDMVGARDIIRIEGEVE